jgi:hypothetical protein
MIGKLMLAGAALWALTRRTSMNVPHHCFPTLDEVDERGQLRPGLTLDPIPGVRVDLSPLQNAKGSYRRGIYTRTSRLTPRGVVLHWPGNSYNTLAKLNAHFERATGGSITMGLAIVDGVPVASIHLPIDARSWHAPDANRYCNGIEIVQPETSLPNARAGGLTDGVRVMECRNGYLSMDARLVEATQTIVRCLAAQSGWTPKCRTWREGRGRTYHGAPPVVPGRKLDSADHWYRQPTEAWLQQGVTVLNHGDVQSNRADIWAWYPQVAAAFPKVSP